MMSKAATTMFTALDDIDSSLDLFHPSTSRGYERTACHCDNLAAKALATSPANADDKIAAQLRKLLEDVRQSIANRPPSNQASWDRGIGALHAARWRVCDVADGGKIVAL